MILWGYIDCYIVDTVGLRQLNLNEFEFKCNGLSSYKTFENDNQQFNITEDSHALHIILYFLNKIKIPNNSDSKIVHNIVNCTHNYGKDRR